MDEIFEVWNLNKYTMIKRAIKHFLLKATGQYSHLEKTVKIQSKWYGNEYGGFYACPGFLNQNSIVYSFGIGEDISFDKSIIENHNCQVFGFDPTPKSIKWTKSQNLPVNFRFFEFGVSDKTGFTDFYLPKNPDYVSGSVITQSNINLKEKVVVEMKTINDILNELHHNHIDVLKMDIEGAEYDIIDYILDRNISVGQILVEFHDRFFKEGNVKSREAVNKLRNADYEIFAASHSYEEISFIKKNLL